MPTPITNNLPRDGSAGAIQAGGSFRTTDAAGLASPSSLSGGFDTIVIPQNAVEVILFPSTNDMAISEHSDFSSYDLVSKGSKEVYGCSGMTSVYVQGGMAADTLYFRFNMLGPVTE